MDEQQTIAGERTHTTLRGHIFPVFSCLPHRIDLLISYIEEFPFRFRPTPSCQFSLACRPQMFPRPQVGGRAGSHRFARCGRRCNPPASNRPARSLTPFVRYRHDACLLTERTTKRRTEREARTNDGVKDETRDGTKEWNDRMYKKSGRVAVIRLPCPPARFCVPASAIARCSRICPSHSLRGTASYR